MDEELEKLRKKKLQELQEQATVEESMEEQETQKEELEKQKKIILMRILTPQARERLGNIKASRPKIGENIENQLIMIAQSGRLENKINDKQLKELLSKIMPKKRDIKIKRR